MTAPGPQLLKPSVILKTSPQTDSASIVKAFGCSRAVLYFWRERFGFPRGVRVGNARMTATADIAAWAHRYNVKIVWI